MKLLSISIGILYLLFSNQPRKANRCVELNRLHFADSSCLIAGKKSKYWNRLTKAGFSNRDGLNEMLNWKFSRDHRMREFIYYKGAKQYKYIYQADMVVGYWKYRLEEDTLILDGVGLQKYLILKLSADSLFVQHIRSNTLDSVVKYVAAKSVK